MVPTRPRPARDAMTTGRPAATQRSIPGTTYAYPGGGRKLSDMGAIFAGARRPAQARIDLMLGLGSGMDAAALHALFEV